MTKTKRFQKNEFFGLFITLLSVFVIISCLSYNSDDLALNVVTEVGSIKNIFGYSGAYVSDIMMQSFGFGSFFVSFGIFIWGMILISGKKIFLFPLRIPIFIITIISFCGFLELLISHKDLFYETLPGGYLGFWFYKKYILKTIIGKIAYGIALFLIIIIGSYISITINFRNVKIILNTIEEIIKAPLIILYPFQVLCRFFRSLLRYNSGIDKNFNKNKSFLSTTIRLLRQLFKIIFLKRARSSFRTTQEMIDFSRNRVVSMKSNELHENDIPNFNSEDARLLNISNNTLNEYFPPSIDLLQEPKINKMNAIDKAGLSRALTQALLDFGIFGEIMQVNQGPVVSLFEFKPKAGTKSSRIIGLSDDIARTMHAISTRISVIQGKDAIGIELPNKSRTTIYLREIFESSEFVTTDAALPIALGKDISGNPIITDLAKMPHLLIAGTTGSGKSVGINAMIMSLIYKLSPVDCRMIMIDPKMLELSVYDGIPHLMTPVITDSKKAIMALRWAVSEMENRYRIMSSLGVRNIINYNTKVEVALRNKTKLTRKIDIVYNKELGGMETETISFEPKKMPYIVVVVDEMADLMIVAGKDVEAQIQRLAQMARAAGIHIIMATQRPSVDVITGVIKANFPSRISFQVTSKIDSRTILGEQGAEQLLGHGDMLFMQGASKIHRIHGPFVSDDEVESIVKYIKERNISNYVDVIDYKPEEMKDLLFDGNNEQNSEITQDEGDLYQMAIRIVKEEKRTSISYIQRKLRIGYNKAANLIEKMEEDGLLSAPDKSGKRIILMNNSD